LYQFFGIINQDTGKLQENWGKIHNSKFIMFLGEKDLAQDHESRIWKPDLH
jgi:uncharacterized protein YjbJ (UPF0337 family)